MAYPSPLARTFLCIIAMLSSSHLHAEDSTIPSRLALEEAVRLAIAQNPVLAVAKNEIQASEGDKVAASKRLNPVFSLQFEDFPVSAHPGPFFDVQEITSRIDYEIERGGRRRLRMESANQALKVQELEVQNQMRLMRPEVERAFYLTILAKANLETSKSILDHIEHTISINKVRFQQGDISALDLKRIEVETLKFQDDLFQAELALRNTKSSLLALLNTPDLSQDVEIIGTLPVDYQNPEPGLPPRVPLDELIKMAAKQRPDLAAHLQEKERAGTETLLQRALRSPNITVGGGYKRNLTDNAIVFGVTIPLKILNRSEGEIIRADAERMRAINLSAALQMDVRLDVQTAHNAVEINHQRVEYIKTQQLKRAEEVSQVTLVIGLALGAFFYSRYAGTSTSPQPPAAPASTAQLSKSEASPDVVQISPASQKEVGIAVEPAAFRNLRDTLSATGSVSEDPGRVAHIRPLARGLIEKAYIRLGDRVLAGDPLVEYDNIELGIAMGDYLSAQAELQRSLTDLEVKKKILERGKEMLKVGAIARTTYDLREAETKDAEAKTAGTRATVDKIAEQIHRFGWTEQDLANLPAKKVKGHSIAHSVLKAPFSGIITAYHASIGEVVEPSTELLSITDMSSLWVMADVFEKDLSHVRVGKSVAD